MESIAQRKGSITLEPDTSLIMITKYPTSLKMSFDHIKYSVQPNSTSIQYFFASG